MSFPIHIPPTGNDALAAEVSARWNSLTKPPGSLGRLEKIVMQLALITGNARPTVGRKAMVIFCADHGVTEEGVSAYPREVTGQMVRNFLGGGAAVSVLCRQFGIKPVIVDAGVDAEPIPGAVDLRLARGTRNFARGLAMSPAQVEEALHNGVTLAGSISQSYDIAAIGEMGIGNTTSASALLCAFTGIEPAKAVGPGTGLSRSGVERKAEVIRSALALHADAVASGDAIAILSAIGGLEIATMAGFMLGAAERRMPVVVDGFIASAAILAARAIAPDVTGYGLFSHVSAEPAHRFLLAELGVQPILDLDLRLGEGSGAAVAMPVIEAAVALYTQMATFAQVGVSEA